MTKKSKNFSKTKFNPDNEISAIAIPETILRDDKNDLLVQARTLLDLSGIFVGLSESDAVEDVEAKEAFSAAGQICSALCRRAIDKVETADALGAKASFIEGRYIH